jgi:hypothetical protein
MYEEQHSGQTLDEGLHEYYAANPGLLDTRTLSPEAAGFFRSHDAVHVVYGCGTSLPEEAYVKICSIFGTTAGLGVLAGYRLHEARRIYRRLPITWVVREFAACMVAVPRAMACCRRQRERWPFDDFEPLRQVPLAEIRGRFGIRVRARS